MTTPPTSAVSIREGTIADRLFVHDLGMATMRLNVPPSQGPSEDALLRSLDNMLWYVESQPHRLLIAEHAQRPAGFLLLLNEYHDDVSQCVQGFIAYMAVVPESHRYGIGSCLLAHAEGLLRAQGVTRMTLMVTASNKPAVEFYKTHFYRPERYMLARDLTP